MTSSSARASRIVLDDSVDPHEYCIAEGFDPLPVIPPTVDRVDRMMAAVDLQPEETIGLIPPCYGAATVEKIAANAVMAGCLPELMRVLIPLVRAACDERLNLHGVQATTNFSAPLAIINGPIRNEFGFAYGQNVFGNVARANSTLGRALQLILRNVGGADPMSIDMSTLGNPGKFSFCIAENEEASPWEPLHVERGFRAEESTVTICAAEAPHGVSEHRARTARGVLQPIAQALATVLNFRVCKVHQDVLVVVGPEHARTISSDGFRKEDVKTWLFENTAVPIRLFDEDAEGAQAVSEYDEVSIDGESCYRKFHDPSSIQIIVSGGTAGKFSAVLAGWGRGPLGSRMVTHAIA